VQNYIVAKIVGAVNESAGQESVPAASGWACSVGDTTTRRRRLRRVGRWRGLPTWYDDGFRVSADPDLGAKSPQCAHLLRASPCHSDQDSAAPL